MAPMSVQDKVEAAAKALYYCWDHSEVYGDWEGLDEEVKDDYRYEARAALIAAGVKDVSLSS